MDQTIAAELSGYQATAAELHRIADAIRDLPHHGDGPPYVTISFLPSALDATDEQKTADVDAVASAVLGCAGKPTKSGPNTWYHLVQASRAGVQISIQEPISSPPDERDAELALLRAKVASLESRDSHGFSREADDPTPGGRIEPHFADGNTGVELVDESERPLVSAATIAEVAAMEVRDREAGGPPWEVPDHPDNAQPGGWHRGQIR